METENNKNNNHYNGDLNFDGNPFVVRLVHYLLIEGF